MLKVIDLDAQGKDSDGYVFTLTVGTEKVGVTDLELADMIKARYAGGRGAKRQPQRRSAAQDALSTESGLNGDGDSPRIEEGDPAH